MWTHKEHLLFKYASHLIVNGQYEEGLEQTTRLMALVAHDHLKWAYAAGCRYAVALRHLNRREEAEQVFEQARQRAIAAGQPVIAAYIAVDWSSEEQDPNHAIQMVQEAIKVCRAAKSTPDPERTLEADIAFFEVIMARYAANTTTMRGVAPYILANARGVLRQYAYGSHPRYKDAYLIALMYERELVGTIPSRANWREWAHLHGLIALEVMRQGRAWAAVQNLCWPARWKRINLRPPA